MPTAIWVLSKFIKCGRNTSDRSRRSRKKTEKKETRLANEPADIRFDRPRPKRVWQFDPCGEYRREAYTPEIGTDLKEFSVGKALKALSKYCPKIDDFGPYSDFIRTLFRDSGTRRI